MSMSLIDWHAMALFEDWRSEEVGAVVDAVTAERRFSDGDVICREGDPPEDWWIVAEGSADVTRDGIYLGTIGEGETIGELAMLDGSPRDATVTASAGVVLHEIAGERFHETMAQAPGLGFSLAKLLAARLRDANRRAGAVTPASVAGRPAPVVVGPERVEFNPMDEDYLRDPTIQLGAIREQEPVHYTEMAGAFLVTRYDDVYRLARDKTVGSDIGHALASPAIEAERAQQAADPTLAMSMLRQDGDDHTRLRRLVSKAFTPRAVERWRERAVEVTNDLLDTFAEAGGGDVIDQYALQLPVQMISEMLGMPTDEIPQLKAWSAAMAKTVDPLCSPGEREAGGTAAAAMSGYIFEIYDRKSGELGDDILSALIAAEEAGDRLSRDEVMANVRLLYVAGHEKTTNLIGNGLQALFDNPEQLDIVRTEPRLDANLVEEVLRYDSPVQFTRRIPINAVAVGEVVIPAGNVIMLCAASANRDPRKWGGTHDDFIVARPGANEQLSFGGGRHFCLGAALARLEAQIALPRIVRRFSTLAPVNSRPVHMNRMVLRGLAELPVIV
jgi:cytochrome P450